MRKIRFTFFTVLLYMACTKTVPPTTVAPPVTNPVTPTTPVTPVTPTPPGQPDSLFGWTKMSKPASSSVYDIWFSTSNVGFITNDSFLLTSTDNGVTWMPVPNTTFPLIFNFQFLDNQNGFVQGLNRLGVTTNGGANWSFSSFPTNNVWNFQFVTTTTGFYYDMNFRIYKTSDAGNHWQNVCNIQNDNIACFYFLDSLNGFYMGTRSFNKTSDGGVTWQKISAGAFPLYEMGFFKMQFLDSMNAYSSSPNGIAKTADGGITWTISLPLPIGAGNYMLPYFFDVNNGYCIMDKTLYKTTDGGQSWTLSCKLANDYFSSLHMLDMNTGWAGTYGGYILHLQ